MNILSNPYLFLRELSDHSLLILGFSIIKIINLNKNV